MKLEESFLMEGKTIDGFKAALEEMDEANSFIHVSSKDIKILSYDADASDAYDLAFREIKPSEAGQIFSGIAPGSKTLNKDSLIDKGASEELISDLIGITHQMLEVPGREPMFVSSNCIGTMASRVLLGGDEFFRPSMLRDALLAERLAKRGQPVTMMVRTVGGTSKCFAVHSGGYADYPQTILCDILDKLSGELGAPECRKWQVSHDMSSIIIAFPEKADEVADMYELPDRLIPGLYLGTSDVGDSSVTAMGVWIKDGVITYDAVYKKKHQGRASAEDILKNIEEKIFPRFTVVPERLAELIRIDIPAEKLPWVYEKVMSQTGISKAMGKKLSKSLLEEMETEINPGLSYTAYNVATTFMDLPRRLISVEKSTKSALEQNVVKAVFCNYNSLKSAPEIILGA